jgi:MerR family transcriptional regulator, light-induced transcriptional regulator
LNKLKYTTVSKVIQANRRFQDETLVKSPQNSPVRTTPGKKEEALTVSAVARRIGVAPATLRTWAHRYGLGPSEHNAGTHRLYSHEDILRLTYMRQLIMKGTPAQTAAQQAIDAKAKELEKYCGIARGITNLVNEATNGADEVRDQSLIKELFHYAEVMDQDKFLLLLEKEIAARGVPNVWINILVPMLRLVGETWQESGKGIETEHFTSECISIALRKAVQEIKNPLNDRPVLLACVENEAHTLPLKALVAALSEVDIKAVSLGAHTPIQTICDAMVRTAPPVLFLWAKIEQKPTLLAHMVESLPDLKIKPRVVLGGPGWGLFSVNTGSANIRRSSSIRETVELISEVFVG